MKAQELVSFMSGNRSFVLAAMCLDEEGFNPEELAQKTGVSKGSVRSVLQALIMAKLVKKRPFERPPTEETNRVRGRTKSYYIIHPRIRSWWQKSEALFSSLESSLRDEKQVRQ